MHQLEMNVDKIGIEGDKLYFDKLLISFYRYR